MMFNWEAALDVLRYGFWAAISLAAVIVAFGLAGSLADDWAKKNPGWDGVGVAAACVAATSAFIVVAAIWVGALG